jgi:hypothetical protein
MLNFRTRFLKFLLSPPVSVKKVFIVQKTIVRDYLKVHHGHIALQRDLVLPQVVHELLYLHTHKKQSSVVLS